MSVLPSFWPYFFELARCIRPYAPNNIHGHSSDSSFVILFDTQLLCLYAFCNNCHYDYDVYLDVLSPKQLLAHAFFLYALHVIFYHELILFLCAFGNIF